MFISNSSTRLSGSKVLTRIQNAIVRLATKPNVLTALTFGCSGLAFIAANLILASVLAVEQYALIALLASIVNVSIGAAPIGADGVVARRSAHLDHALLRRVFVTSAVIGSGAAVVASVAYRIPAALAGLALVCICAGGVIVVIAARYQAVRSFGRSLVYLRSTDFSLLTAALVAVVTGTRHALIPFGALALALSSVALMAWRAELRTPAPTQAARAFDWREALAYLSLPLSGGVLIQLDRLLTPKLLSLEDLATLGIVLAIVGPPFRLLQQTVGYALQPRLLGAKTNFERRRLILREGLGAAGVVIAVSALLWLLAPMIVQVTLEGKYSLTREVMLAALISGTLKVANGFAKACVTALSSNRELAYVGIISWIGVGAAIAGAVVGSRFGLAGIIYGVACGWAIRALAASFLVASRFRADKVSR